MEAHFRVTDGDAEMPLVFSVILPDLFREKQAVVATGRMRGDGTFVAEQVLATPAATYVPKQVADKIRLANEKPGVKAANQQAGNPNADTCSAHVIASPSATEGKGLHVATMGAG